MSKPRSGSQSLQPSLLLALEHVPEAIFLTDGENRIVYANLEAKSLTQCVWSELDHLSIGGLFVESAAADGNEDPQPRSQERFLKTKGGPQRVYIRATDLPDSKGGRLGVVYALHPILREWEPGRHDGHSPAQVRGSSGLGSLAGASASWRKVLEQIRMAGSSSATVLIVGEPGTGKGMIARAIHNGSCRAAKPFCCVSCAGPRRGLGQELFGNADAAGWVESANGGTLFFEEIGETPLEIQAKLLRVIESGELKQIGDEATRKTDVRVVAATSRNLLAEAKAGRFLEDLYYRLSLVQIESPPLRQRKEDLQEIAEYFLNEASADMGLSTPRLTKAHLEVLRSYSWPGNIRELKNVIERAVILSRHTGQLHFEPGTTGRPLSEATKQPAASSLRGYRLQERELIMNTLDRTGGRIYGPDGAAALLGMRPTTLSSRLKRYGVPRPSRGPRQRALAQHIEEASSEDVILD